MLLKSLFHRVFRTRRRRNPIVSHKPKFFRPVFDALERRDLPSISILTLNLSGAPATQVSLSATFSDDGPGPQSEYSGDINWGDGTDTPAMISATPWPGEGFGGQAGGFHTYAQEGSFIISLTISGSLMDTA